MTKEQATIFIDYLDYLIVEHANLLASYRDYPNMSNVDFHFEKIKETQINLINLLTKE